MNRTGLGRMEVGRRKPDVSGKVRDIFDLGDSMLFVATDRISAFDLILPSLIPGKGVVLSSLSAFWFDRLAPLAANHVISTDPADYPEPFRSAADRLEGRSMLVRRADLFPFECVARGYLAGSGWKDYRETGSICGVTLPPGLAESERLPDPIFTPSTKATKGHDAPVTFDDMVRALGGATADSLRRLTLSLYAAASEDAAQKGVLIADTKFEFGLIGGTIHLVDEALTPDSSRFWKADRYRPGRRQESFDKQFVREYLLGINWKGDASAPALPEAVVESTANRYREIFDILTS